MKRIALFDAMPWRQCSGLTKLFVIALAVLAGVVGLCVLDLRCRGPLDADTHVMRMKGEWTEGRKAMRQQEAENLAQLARDFRVLAQRYKESGEKKKAQRAIGAAQELDRKIAALLEEKQTGE